MGGGGGRLEEKEALGVDMNRFHKYIGERLKGRRDGEMGKTGQNKGREREEKQWGIISPKGLSLLCC